MIFEHIEEKEAAKRAALIEMNGYKFYSMLAGKTHDKKTKAAFKSLADDERKHLRVIEKKYFAEAGFPDTVTEEEVAIEQYLKKSGTTDLFTKRIDIEKLSAIVDDPKKALIVALDTERYSVEYFENLAKGPLSGEVREIYRDLADEERAHVLRIEGLLAQYGKP